MKRTTLIAMVAALVFGSTAHAQGPIVKTWRVITWPVRTAAKQAVKATRKLPLPGDTVVVKCSGRDANDHYQLVVGRNRSLCDGVTFPADTTSARQARKLNKGAPGSRFRVRLEETREKNQEGVEVWRILRLR